jgi:phospholipid transport system substrate-binding protein
MKYVRIYNKVIAAFISIFLCLLATSAAADSPTVEIKSTVDQVIKLLTDPRLSGESNKQERRRLLRDTILSQFDFKEMSRRSLGSNWRRLTPKQQDEFVGVFTDLLEKAYLGRIESYNKERFIYINEAIDEPYAEVRSKIVTSRGEEFSINYRLKRTDGMWKIYDVVVEDISLVNNYRSQFDRILSKTSYDELIRRMKEKLSDSRNAPA